MSTHICPCNTSSHHAMRLWWSLWCCCISWKQDAQWLASAESRMYNDLHQLKAGCTMTCISWKQDVQCLALSFVSMVMDCMDIIVSFSSEEPEKMLWSYWGCFTCIIQHGFVVEASMVENKCKHLKTKPALTFLITHLYKNTNIINLVWFVQFQDSLIEVQYVVSKLWTMEVEMIVKIWLLKTLKMFSIYVNHHVSVDHVLVWCWRWC